MEQQNAHRVDVAADVERLAARLLGRHVLGGSDHEALGGDAWPACSALEQLGDAEVTHLHDVVGAPFVVLAAHDHDVLGLEVAMDDADVVRHREGGERLGGDVDDAGDRQG